MSAARVRCAPHGYLALALIGALVLAAFGQGARGQGGGPRRPFPPWPPQYKAGGTAADVLGPDGRTWFPDWTYAGVQGGIPDVAPFARIEDFGGRADDDADDAAALQAACQAAGLAGGGAVLLGEGTYHLDRKVLITLSGVVIRGAGRDRTRIVIRYNGNDDRIKDGVILFKGVTHVSHDALAADARRGDTSLRMFNVDGLAPGDWIMVDAPGTERWRHVIASRCRFNPRLAMVRIERIAGTTLTINQPLRIDFPRIDSPHVTKMAPISDCGIEDLYITQQQRPPKICTVLFWGAVNCWGRRVTVEWTGRMPLYGSHVKWMEVRDCEFNNGHDTGGGGSAYVGWQYGFDCLMENVVARNLRHAPNLDWSCSGCVFRNSSFYNTDAQTHSGWCHENLFENCVIVDPIGHRPEGGPYGHGFWATPPGDRSHGPNGPRNCFYNCDFQNADEHKVFGNDMRRYGPTGLVLGGMNENWLFFYNRVLSRGPGILLRGVSFDHVIAGNVFLVEDGFPAVLLESPAQCAGIVLAGNVLYGGDGTVVTNAPPALAAWEGNRAFARPGSVPPRPQPEVPSIFEWQRRHRQQERSDPQMNAD